MAGNSDNYFLVNTLKWQVVLAEEVLIKLVQ